ncbi:MAG: hemagglutinin repeat-containing protein [Acidaminococcaceae bacterium]|nr:hemagglutinin repeat-containing protein [Acidaminococcaceae bacterium]
MEHLILWPQGSNVLAGGDVNIKATEKDIDVHGSNVSGENVNLDAAEKVNITAGENTNKTDTDNKSSSAGFGVSISTTGGVGAYVSASTAKEKIKENSTTHTLSTVTAKDKLTIKSGKDTNITGSKVGGGKVEADIEGNLNIESLQEKQAYKEKSSTAGISISGIGLGTPNISGSAGAGKMKSDHVTVTDQAEIYAGKKGFDIKVKGNTDLKGAVIDSKASADKNKIDTGTISFKDIENKAEYDTSGIGISYDGAATKDPDSKMGDKGLIPNIPIGSSDEATSTTKSGVAPGTITIKDKDKQKQDIRDLNRDTTNTLNKLDQIFDKDTIQEKQEMAELFGELAYNQIHDISKRAGWKDGDKNKAALHAIVGGIMAKLGDGNFLAGASGATVNELIQKELSKIKDPALHQWASAAVGAAVGGIVGGKTGAKSGTSTATMGTKENLELDSHSAKVRADQYEKIKKSIDDQFLLQEKEGMVCSEEEANKALERLKETANIADKIGLTPSSNELLNLFLNQDFDKHGIVDTDQTVHGYKIIEFGKNSIINREYRSNYDANLRLVRNAIGKRGNSGVSIPTDVDSHSFYQYGVDLPLALGDATAFVSFRKNENNIYDAKITIIDNWDHSIKEAKLGKGTFLEDVYKVQQSGKRKTFGYKTTYDVEFTQAELWPHRYGERTR